MLWLETQVLARRLVVLADKSIGLFWAIWVSGNLLYLCDSVVITAFLKQASLYNLRWLQML